MSNISDILWVLILNIAVHNLALCDFGVGKCYLVGTGVSGMRTECDVQKHVLMNSSVNCRHVHSALSNKLCPWEYLLILLK
jgi:hypothetical protein